MRKLAALAFVLALSSTACLGGGTNERTVLVDFSYDEFSTIMLANFPSELTVAAGDTIVFKQIWTGEPHTVTGGTLVDDELRRTLPLVTFGEAYDELRAQGAGLPDPEGELPEGNWSEVIEKVERAKDEDARERWLDSYDGLVEQGLDIPARGDEGDTSLAEVVEVIDAEFAKVFESDDGLPYALAETEEGFGVAQNAGQPCYLDSGGPPKDADKPCPKSRQRQPAFNGKQSYYNSGIIPYEGPRGNTFRVDLDPQIDPGTYYFMCSVHGPFQRTKVDVRPLGADTPSQETVSRRARSEIATFAGPMRRLVRDAQDGSIEIDGRAVEGPFGGLSPPVRGAVNEFLPKTIRARVGEKVSWKLMGWDHSVSFDVPRYFPIIQFAENGEILLNPRLDKPAGGSPEIPEGDEGEILRVDGGTYDGSGFFSSGLMSAEPYAEYSLRFSRPGTYKYACLIHPPMVGTVDVR